MKTARFLLPFLVALAAISILSGCASGPIARPTTPPTFVMAWTLDGPPGQVWTVESNDGIIWRNAGPQNLQGNLSESSAGPAIAHDGNLAWMLMWPNPRGLDYKIGTGGVALSGQGGVVWEPQPHQGRLPFTAIGGRPAGSPALTFGQGRWVAAFRTAGTGVTKSPAGVPHIEPRFRLAEQGRKGRLLSARISPARFAIERMDQRIA